MVFLIKMFSDDKLKFTFYLDLTLNRELLWLGEITDIFTFKNNPCQGIIVSLKDSSYGLRLDYSVGNFITGENTLSYDVVLENIIISSTG